MKDKNTNSKDQFTVVLEQINSKIDILVEGYQFHNGKFDRMDERLDRLEGRFEKVECRFDVMEERFNTLEGRFDTLETELKSFKSDTERNFKSVADYLARIEAELQDRRRSQNSKEELASLEKRIVRIEQAFPGMHLSRAKA